MNDFRQIFSNRHSVLPVIHVESAEQALRNTEIARESLCDGVFLINHSIADESLLEIHKIVSEKYPDWWIGVNCLGISPDQCFRAVSGKVGGVWADNSQIEEDNEEQPYAEKVLETRNLYAPHCLYFGGVAFKYQRKVEDLESACQIAARYMDVVTTSGTGTGQAAEIEKIRRMKLALGDTPLAIASGITPENINDYLPFADGFLVATGISRSFTELDAERVKFLVKRVREFLN